MNPSAKVTAGGAAGALVVLITWVMSLIGADMPTLIDTVLAFVLALGAAYMKRETSPSLSAREVIAKGG